VTELIASIVAKNSLLAFLAITVRQKNIYWTAKKKAKQVTSPKRNWRFSALQTHLWLIKLWFSASTFVVKIANFFYLHHVMQEYFRRNFEEVFKSLRHFLSNFPFTGKHVRNIVLYFQSTAQDRYSSYPFRSSWIL